MNDCRPLKKATDTAEIVSKGDLRKYYRFRPARFYGGIATADCVGCCLRCLFCWSWHQVIRPEKHGRFYSPCEVAGNLKGIARKKRFRQVRISGNEPTLAREHLLQVLELIPDDLLFILETNGILIGADETYAKDLSRYENLHVRVSLKGCAGKEFSRLTGANPTGFELQIQALENLIRFGVSTHPAVMVSFSGQESVRDIRNRLSGIRPEFASFEIEELAMFGDVENRLRNAGML
ncbi:radical SAM protein [Desulfobacterales bacterium HSG2]|nr:radical SAM protein [Desulfobacterales bacterium HSG2]